MSVVSTTLSGVNVFQFSGAVTDAQIQTAFASTISEGRYVLNRAIYLDNTADLTAVTGGFFVDFGTQVLPAIILHTSRDKTKSTFKNFTFFQRTGLSVTQRNSFVQLYNGSILSNAGGGSSSDGISQNGGGFIYAVAGNPGGADPRYLNEMPFLSMEGATIYSQEFTEQELQICVGTTTQLKGLIFEKCYGFPQIGTPSASTNVVVYRSSQNTQSVANGGLIPIRLYPSGNRHASICYVDSYITRNNADVTTRLVDAFGSNASNPASFTVLNNFERGSWFGTSKTNIAITTWNAANTVYGGVLKKLQFVNGNGGVVRCYDSRSTTVAQKCSFKETGFIDFVDTNLAPTTDSTGKISLVHIGAIATGATAAIARYTSQKYTFQKFGYRVLVGTPDMTTGDNDLSSFTPVVLTPQTGIVRTQAAINAATTITSFQDLLEELHVLAIGLSGEQSYNAYNNGNLFEFTGTELKTNFTTVNVDATASSKISYNAATNTLTIKASNLVGNNVVNAWNNSIGSINLLNGTTIQGVYTSTAGTSTVLKLENISAGASVCVWNTSTGATEFFQVNNTATAQDYFIYYPPGNDGLTKNVARELYGYKRYDEVITLAGGEMWWTASDQEDVGITDTKTVASAYTTLSTTSQIYDATAIFRLSETGIKLGQLCTRDGLYLDFSTYNVKIKDDASAIVSVTSGTITYKSIVINETTKYNAMKATPPKTITPTDTEIINVLIEDANGDSKVSILGGDNLGYELWKVTTATATDDYATGTLLTTLADNTAPYRFIGISGYDMVGRDISSGVRRRSSMFKGTYTQAFYVGNQIQLATDAPQLQENNDKLDELLLKIDTKLDVAVSTRLADADYIDPATAQQVWEYTTRTLTSEGASGATLAEIEASTILAKKAQIDALGTPLQADDYIAPDNTKIAQIETKVDNIYVQTGTISLKVDTLENYDDTALQAKIDASGSTNKADLTIINNNVKKASKFIPASQNLT